MEPNHLTEGDCTMSWIQSLTWWQWVLILLGIGSVISTVLVWAACALSSRFSRDEERKADCEKYKWWK